MAGNDREPRNPFYILLIIAGFAFVMTALAYALVPVLEQKAREAGSPPPPSPLRDSLRNDGWIWLLAEAAIIAVLSLASMGYDRWLRTLKERRERETIATNNSTGNTESPQPPLSTS